MWRHVIAWLILALPASALDCRQIRFEETPFTVCEVDLAHHSLDLWLYDDQGDVIGNFGRLTSHLARRNQRLLFAMNAGMYHVDRAPVGLYVEDNERLRGLVTRAGPGNFGMLPNGVLCIGDDRAEVMETTRYDDTRPDCRHATQSGPMLVIDGALHPRFMADGTSRHIRNGVGTRAGGRVAVFAISDERVNFHRFARLFRDVLKTPNALYLDGKISRLYAPDLGRADGGLPMGPILGVADRD